MKLILAIVQQEDAGDLVNALTGKGYRATRIDTAGGFLKRGNATILLGVNDPWVDDALSVIEANCKRRTETVNPIPPIAEMSQLHVPYPTEVQVGGATVFVLKLDYPTRG